MDRINRIKVVLAEKQRTNKWLANQRDGSWFALACFGANSNVLSHWEQTKRTVPLVCLWCV